MNVKINEEANVSQYEVVGFSDQNQQWIYGVDNRLDDVHTFMDSDDASPGKFFSRPIDIATINWPVGQRFGVTLNPWQLYFQNLRVINRISNYHLLRSKLHVRIVINGNGFHQGRALASYRPLHAFDDYRTWRYNVRAADTIAASQRMHVWLDPTKSQGGSLCLPFVYHKNMMNVVEMDWQEMGELDIAAVTSLEHDNGGTDSVSLKVWAWAEDVSLSIPTIAEPGALAPQAYDEMDEAARGPISGPAATVSRVAGALAVIPQIRPFALATQMASDTVGNIAKMFGMSRPVDIDGISSYKPSYAGNMPNANVMDTSVKLTYDVKQELTIDPIACGLGPADEMSMLSIAQRESYITQFPWSKTTPPETMLWNTWVTPTMADREGQEIHMTPSAFVVAPFKHWRGSMKYRFQIVASAFHKGRIKIVYEPYLSAGGNTEYNTQLTHVIDLAKERDFTVTINWGQELSYLETLSPGTVPFSTDPLTSPFHGSVNGLLYVTSVTDLTNSSSFDSSIAILVSSSAGDDFEVANPKGLGRLTSLEPQSGGNRSYFRQLNTYCTKPPFQYDEQGDLQTADGDLTMEESAPIQQESEADLGTKLSTSDNTMKIYFGDPITSIRQVLKRYEPYAAYAQLSNNNGFMSKYVLNNFPYTRGYGGSGQSLHAAAEPADPTSYNFVNNTLLTYFTPAFLCRRGGIRWKYIYTGVSSVAGEGLMSVKRAPDNAGYQRFSLATQSSGSRSNAAIQALNRVPAGHDGMVVTPVSQNPVLEVEMPFHTNFRFIPARKRPTTIGLIFDHFHELQFPNKSNSDGAVLAFLSVGEDFSLSFFQSVPIMYETDDPNPSVAV